MAISLQNSFGLKLNDDNVAIALDPTTSKCKKFALFGDAKLYNLITEQLTSLIDDDSFTVGNISMKREAYKMNSSLGAYLKHNKENIYKLILRNDPEKRNQLNDHSLGTVFEALFHLASEEKCIGIVRDLMKWVDGDGEQYIKRPLLKYSVFIEMDANDNSQVVFENCFKFDQVFEEVNENNSKKLFEELSNHIQGQAVLKLRETNSVDRLINGKIIQGDHLEEPNVITWRSRAGNYYDQKVFPCCGKLCMYNSTCARKNWINKDSYHSGKLVGSGSNRSGGGQTPCGSNIDHIPKAKATWSCCHRAAESEGCVLTGYSALFSTGKKKLATKKPSESEYYC